MILDEATDAGIVAALRACDPFLTIREWLIRIIPKSSEAVQALIMRAGIVTRADLFARATKNPASRPGSKFARTELSRFETSIWRRSEAESN